MKIQVTQVLPNGQVLQQVLSKEGGETFKTQAQPGAKIGFNVEGAKPADGGNTKAKTGNIKKVGNNLVLESEGEALVEVTDFYSTPGASVGDVGWSFVAGDAAVTAVTPEAQALAVDGAAAESSALLPAIAPGWLAVGGAAAVAAAGVNRGSDAAKVVGAVLVIGLALGPSTDAGSGTTVKVYKANGTELAGSGAWVDGKFVFTPTEAYSGKVFIRVIDGDSATDYMDEVTGVAKNMGSDLWAATEVGSGASSVPITVTPITTVAALKAVGATSVTDMSTKVASGNGANADITNTNKAIANLFGLPTSEDLAQQTPEMAITSGGTSSTPNPYGKALAVLSKVDVTTGSFIETIEQLVAATTVTGATATFEGSSVVTALAAAATSTTVAGVALNSAEIQASAAAAPADSTAPVFTSAVVSANGLTLTLTYGEALDGTNVPVANNFVVNVGGVARTVSSLSVSGSTVVLTLASAVYASEVVTVGYTDPTAGNDANAIQDTAGNDAATIAAQTVTNSSTVTVPDQPGSIAAISGTVEQGQTLTAGEVTDADGSISGTTYQWKADGANISGATGSTYVLTQAEVGKAITVVATYTDGHGSGKSVTSAATGAVANIDDVGSIAAISGTVEQGQTLTAGEVTDADDSISGITYQWKADGANISGATSSTYVLTQAEVGKVITVVATYTDGHGSGKSVTSTATSSVANIDDAGSIAVTGTATQGQVLTAGSITDADGNISGITYQWKADGNEISGATNSTYVLTQGDVGKTITVVATYTDGHGSGKSVTSTATRAVFDTTPPVVQASAISAVGDDWASSNSIVNAGETMTAVFDPTGNEDVASVEFDFSDFGGGAATLATLQEDGPYAGKWVATYTLEEGVINTNGLNVKVTVSDTSNNVTGPVLDDSNLTASTLLPPSLAGATLSMAGGNLSTWSQTLNNWIKWDTSTVVSNVEKAPDGTVTAEHLVQSNSSSRHGIYFGRDGLTTGQYYTYSVYLKAGDVSKVALEFWNPPNSYTARFDLANGVVTSQEGEFKSVQLEAVGDGWYRAVCTFEAANAYAEISVKQLVGNTVTTFAGNGTSYISMWGGQLEQGTAATAYMPTQDSSISTPDTTITKAELADGFGVNVKDLSGVQAGDKVQLLDAQGDVVGTSATLLEGQTSATVLVTDSAGLNNGTSELHARLIDSLGGAGAISTAALTVSVNKTDPASAAGATLSMAGGNLSTWSQTLNEWAKWGDDVAFPSTVDSDVETAPDGTLTAEHLVQSSSTSESRHGIHIIHGAFQADEDYTYSVYLKAGDVSKVALGFWNAPNLYTARFDLANGVVTSQEGEFKSVQLEDVGDGWYRAVCTFTAKDPSIEISVKQLNANSSDFFVGNGTSYISMWGGQLEQGTTATAYTATLGNTVQPPDTTITTAELATGVAIRVSGLTDIADGDRIELIKDGTPTGILSDSLQAGATQTSVHIPSTYDGLINTHTYSFTARVVDVLGSHGLSSQTSLGLNKVEAIAPPIVLDFSRDGQIDYVTEKSQDMDGDGKADNTSWVGNSDAVLFADHNADGLANAVEWQFGGQSKGLTDLEGLALLDDNGNGLIDQNDAIWGQLSVWQDANGDGVSVANEVFRLEQVGIESIQLQRHDQAAHLPADGVQVYGSAWANMADGSKMLMHDAAFAYSQQPVL